ncbi:hypothetical protein NEMIN01_0693 [Nematocida minor]|uniref:uncharacterized protein n=1 Tax=Nematocida minor TaxID=1912983 RepID=UPI002220536B|nr:uncharacterized protein NEMIN01_0693 [Nematocida minor]KAI5189830.1 hypothetical protein NEMIN01_0693 [Nematocida minor]
MKNQEIRKLLGAGAALLSFFTGCRGSSDNFDGKGVREWASIDRKRKIDEVHETDSMDIIDRLSKIDVLSAVYDYLGSQLNKRPREEEETPVEQIENVLHLQQKIEDTTEYKDISVQSPVLQYFVGGKEAMERKEKRLINLWNNSRLGNMRRRGYKIDHKTVYRNVYPDSRIIREVEEESYQIELKNDLMDFLNNVKPYVKKNAFSCFIASRCKSTNRRYKDLFGLKTLIENAEDEITSEMLESLDGYYPGVIDDMIAYIKKNEPIKVSKNTTLTAWNQTVGDIYMQKHLDLNYCLSKEQEDLMQLEQKYHALAYAVRMIMILPEVYQDFYSITEDFIERHNTSNDSDVNQENRQVLLGMHKLVGAHRAKKQSKKMYIDFYNTLKSTYMGRGIEESTSAELYREIYTLLAKFYENAEVVDKKANYVLAGKCVIKNQKCMKCEMTVTMAPEDLDKRVAISRYSLEKHSWSVAPNVNAHYHVYYVDNALGQIKMLCMPIYKEDGSEEEHYLHTVSEIVEYIKTLYGIEKYADVIHPFKVNKKSRKWSYIKEKEERNKTVKELEGYEVVFYHIEEDVSISRLTFAQFVPWHPYNEDAICVPLFLNPLMRIGIDIGPFIMVGEHKEIDLLEFKDIAPSIYKYSSMYAAMSFSDMHSYYRNLSIPLYEWERRGTECYSMNCSSARESDGTIKAVWYTRTPSSMDEYTHCVLDKAFYKKENTEKFSTFINTVDSKEYGKHSELQAFWLGSISTEDGSEVESQAKIIHTWVADWKMEESISKEQLECINLNIKKEEKRIEEAEVFQENLGPISKSTDTPEAGRRKRAAITIKSYYSKNLKNLQKKLSEKPCKKLKVSDTGADFLVFRNINQKKSQLHAHNELLDILIRVVRI